MFQYKNVTGLRLCKQVESLQWRYMKSPVTRLLIQMIVQASIKDSIRVQDYRSYLNGSPHIGPLMRKRSNVMTSCRWGYMKHSSERQKTVLRFLKSPAYQLSVQQFIQTDRQWLCAKLLPELDTTLIIAAYKCHQVSTKLLPFNRGRWLIRS